MLEAGLESNRKESKMGRKLSSLIQLAGMGFNTPVFEAIFPGDVLTRFENEFMRWGKVSLRCDTVYPQKYVFMLPFHPNLPWKEAIKKIPELLKEGNVVIASKGIDPTNSLVAGKWVRVRGGEYIECFVGPGTVRDMEDGTKSLIQIGFDPYTSEVGENKLPLVMIPYRNLLAQTRLMTRKRMEEPWILEFSIYSEPVGSKNSYIIFWELG